MARYLLDSNALLELAEVPGALSKEARKTIEDPHNELFVSLASLWELAIKAASGRLPGYARLIAQGSEALSHSLQSMNLAVLGISLRQALAAAALPRHHGDPFDRVMIAQAILEDMTLITRDRIFRRYAGVRVLAA
jgi:PIN domain nuclease of toxin-antitoxin system